MNNINQAISLYEAAQTGNADSVESLLQKGVNIDTRDENGETALSLAITANCPKAAQILFEKGATIKTYNDHDKKTILEKIIKARRCPLFLIYCLTQQKERFNLEQNDIDFLLHEAINQYIMHERENIVLAIPSALKSTKIEEIQYVKYQLIGFFKDSKFGYQFIQLLFPEKDISKEQYNFQDLKEAEKIIIAYFMYTPYEDMILKFLPIYDKRIAHHDYPIDEIYETLDNIFPPEIIDHITQNTFPHLYSDPKLFSDLPFYPLYKENDLHYASRILLNRMNHFIIDESLHKQYCAIENQYRKQAPELLKNLNTQQNEIIHTATAMRM